MCEEIIAKYFPEWMKNIPHAEESNPSQSN
jgi:hypothetical protein